MAPLLGAPTRVELLLGMQEYAGREGIGCHTLHITALR